MTQRTPLVAANWKMNGSITLVKDMQTSLSTAQLPGVEILICPPATLLSNFDSNLSFALGGQTVSQHKAGAYTGELSAELLQQVGVSYVLVGHSERRTLFAEDDNITLAKVLQAVACGLTPVVCVGENLQQRQQEKTIEVLAKQLAAVYASHPELVAKTVIAYEPVWAIGTGEAATPEQAQAAHRAIRQQLACYDAAAAAKVRILYGGSVNATNARDLFSEADIDGGLVGGASLKPAEFLEICQSAKD